MDVIEFNSSQKKVITTDLAECSDQEIAMLLIDQNIENDSILGELEKLKNLYPIIFAQDTQIDVNNFENIQFEQIVKEYKNFSNRWGTQNTIGVLEEIFALKSHLSSLYLKERNTFFEELWHLLKKTIPAYDLSILFHDISEVDEDKKNDRPQLIETVLEGTIKPQFRVANDSEKAIMSNYKDRISECFEVETWQEEKGQMVLTMHVNQSPIIVMAKTVNNNFIFKSVFKALFNGLQGS